MPDNDVRDGQTQTVGESERHPEGAWEKACFFATLLAAIAVLAVIAWPMLLGQVYTLDDLSWYHIPMRAFYARCLTEGKDFTWNPYVYCGYYLHGEGQVGMYHPLHRFLYGFLPFTEAFNIEVFLPYPVMLSGMYFFLRRWRLARDASMFAALVFTFSGFNLLHLIHMNAIATIAHTPWILMAVDVYFRERGRKAAMAAAAVAILAGSQVLLGYPQYVWFSSFVAVLYVLLLRPYWRGVASVLLLLGVAVSGALIGGVQIIPTLEVFRDSTRLNSPDYATGDLSLPPSNLFQFVGPYLYDKRIVTNHPSSNTHEYGLYTGAVAAVLCFWFLLNAARLKEKRRLAFGAAILLAFSLVMMTGKYGVLYTLVSRLPVVGWFRAPCRYISLVHLSVAVLAGLAFELARRAGEGHAGFRVKLWPLAVLPVLSIVAVLMAGFGRFESWWTFLSVWAAKDLRMIVAGPLLVCLAALAIVLALRGWRMALVALVVFAAVDQAIYGLLYLRKDPAMSIQSLADTVRMPAYPGFYRIEAVPSTDNVATLNGHRLVTGYVGLNPRKSLNYTETAPLRLASAVLLGLKEDVSSDGAATRRVKLQPVESPMPRARLVSRTVVSQDPAAVLNGIDIGTTAVVSEELSLSGEPGIVSVTRDDPGAIGLSVTAYGRQLAVLSESYHRGWQATVDGRPARTVRVYGDFLGVLVESPEATLPEAVPSGGLEHDVELVFRPRSLVVGGIVSACGLLCAAVCVMLAARVRKGNPPGEVRAGAGGGAHGET